MTWINIISKIPVAQPLVSWVWREAILGSLGGVLGSVLADPRAARGAVRRIGDAVVWDGEGGTRVLAHLEALGDSQTRIQAAVSGLSSPLAAAAPTFAVLQSLSMLNLGVSALSGGLMLWRLAALRRRLDDESQRIRDIEGHITAAQKAVLQAAMNNLDLYESPGGGKPSILEAALQQANVSAHTYQILATDEATSRRRIEVLSAPRSHVPAGFAH